MNPITMPYAIIEDFNFMIIVYYLVILLISLYFIYRSNKVYKYLTDLLDKIYEVTMLEINSDMSSSEIYDRIISRYDYLNSISFDEIVFKFWIPINDFYNMERFNFPLEKEEKVS